MKSLGSVLSMDLLHSLTPLLQDPVDAAVAIPPGASCREYRNLRGCYLLIAW